MKKQYMKPAITAVKLQHLGIICTSVTEVNSGDTGISFDGGGSGPARARQHGSIDWDDQDDQDDSDDWGE